ncbi:tautomerase family protein [Cellulomonas soli]|uniref:Tautomerase n=1 Tax=Cellulomonas soli TaxID=931535 RepID=A0A512P9L3_9CELL|nr:tautomerase family protein [Cellulomonas soli]NYI60372.1 phenylpyruvate tautomerase PptA (4-oxalocrotonate tautomerase family) [Cellulomonas soli]GEP67885.1 tautomerase [Cellulomonas soli]
MAHLTIYGRRDVWADRRREVSDALHAALVGAWGLPEEKRFHRFVLLDPEDLIAPRGPEYLVVEVVAFAGRSRAARRELVRRMFDDVAPALGLGADDLEMVLLESPPENWGIRGVAGDELTLPYRTDV